MLKACAKCGKIHQKSYVCMPKAKQERNTEADRFRNKQVWRRKSESIKERDMHLCRVCLTGKYNARVKYNSDSLSVHHIVPLSEAYDKRLDDTNLITLCSYHHELAERGVISRQLLQALAANPPAL